MEAPVADVVSWYMLCVGVSVLGKDALSVRPVDDIAVAPAEAFGVRPRSTRVVDQQPRQGASVVLDLSLMPVLTEVTAASSHGRPFSRRSIPIGVGVPLRAAPGGTTHPT